MDYKLSYVTKILNVDPEKNAVKTDKGWVIALSRFKELHSFDPVVGHHYAVLVDQGNKVCGIYSSLIKIADEINEIDEPERIEALGTLITQLAVLKKQ